VIAENDSVNFLSNIIYVPVFHSRPLFIKDFHSGPVAPVKKISVNEPKIADVKIITPYELVIDGRYPLSTMLIVWYEDNSVDFFEIRVTLPRAYRDFQVEVIRGTESCK